MLDITKAPFNCRGDGVTDCSEGFERALAAVREGRERALFAPAGCYLLRGGHVFSTLGMSLTGEGVNATRFVITDPEAPGFVLAHSGAAWPAVLADVSLTGFSLERGDGSPVEGVGIDASAPVYRVRLENLLISGHKHGLVLGETDYSIVRDVIVQANVRDGVLLRNTASGGACQYTFERCLFQANGGHGFLLRTKAGPRSVSLGEFINVSTWANAGWGMSFEGCAETPAFGVRVLGGFFGEDAQGGVRLRTHGGYHKIVGASIELCGRLPGEPDALRRIGSAPGLCLSETEQDVLVQGVRINGAQGCGLITGAAVANIQGCSISNCGLDNTVTEDRVGVRVLAGRAHITGNTIFNLSKAKDQAFGVQVRGGTVTPADLESVNLIADHTHQNFDAGAAGELARWSGTRRNAL